MAIKKRFKAWLESGMAESEPEPTNPHLRLTYYDLKRTQPSARLWGAAYDVEFCLANSLNLNTWLITAYMVANGLSWWQSWLCVWIGNLIASYLIYLMGRIGAEYHIPFPVLARAPFGTRGSLGPVFSTIIMGSLWHGVQTWLGGQCVTVMITSVWSSYSDLGRGRKHDSVPAPSGVTTKDLLSFLVFWCASLSAVWFPFHEHRHSFKLVLIFIQLVTASFCGWVIGDAGAFRAIFLQGAEIEGSTLIWALAHGTMLNVANCATLIVGDSNFIQLALQPSNASWMSHLYLPYSFAFNSLAPIFFFASAKYAYPNEEFIWNPLTLLSKYLHGANAFQRFAVFITATAIMLTQLSPRFVANARTTGTSLTALLPHSLTTRRGSYICAVIGLAMCPWNFLKDLSSFVEHLSLFSIFLSSIAGIVLCDFYLVRKSRLDLKGLYMPETSSSYHYSFGFSFRGYAAYIAGFFVNVMGFLSAMGVLTLRGMEYIHRVHFVAGFLVAGFTYYIFCKAFPLPARRDAWREYCQLDEDLPSLSTTESDYDEQAQSGSEKEA